MYICAGLMFCCHVFLLYTALKVVKMICFSLQESVLEPALTTVSARAANLAETNRETVTETTSVPETMFVEKITAGNFQGKRRGILTAVYQVEKIKTLKYLITSFLEVRLVGGSGGHEGNILVGGKPVCDDGHSSENALVVCR